MGFLQNLFNNSNGSGYQPQPQPQNNNDPFRYANGANRSLHTQDYINLALNLLRPMEPDIENGGITGEAIPPDSLPYGYNKGGSFLANLLKSRF